MAESAELVEYVLVTEKGDTQNTSNEYTGKGKATYPNGDVYEGEFKNGVSTIPTNAFPHLRYANQSLESLRFLAIDITKPNLLTIA